MKKLFYAFITILIYLLFNQLKVNAVEYCSLFLDNEFIETIELPFYLYENSITYTIKGASLPTISTSTVYEIIDSSTRCDKINKIIKNDNSNPISNKTFYDYTKEIYKKELDYNDIPLSKINKNGTLKGYSSYEDKEPPYFEGYKEKYTTNINSPIDLSIILNQIHAYDKRDEI